MKVIAKKFRGVWHYGVITGVVTEWVLEDYGGATQWRAVFEDGGIVGLLRSEVRSGKVTVQPGWVMGDCLHHMETFSILNAGPLLEEARVKAIMPEKELASPAVVRSVSRLAVLGHMYKRLQGAAWFVTRWGLQNVVTEEDGPERKAQRGAKARRPGQRGAKARRPGQRGAKARRPGQRGAKARRPGQRGAKARRPGQRGAKARRPGQRGAKARRPGQRGAKARRPGQRGAKARRPGQRGAKARRPGQRGAKARRPGQRGAKARRPGQRGAKARRPGQRGAKARRPGQRGAKARRPGQRGAKARRPGQRGAKARRPGQRGANASGMGGAARRQGAAAGAARRQGAAAGAARRQGAAAGAARRQDSAYSGIGGKGCITSCGRQPLKTMRSCRNNPNTGFWIPLIWLAAAGCGMQGRMTELAVLVSPESLHAAEAAQPHMH
eukprot:jgi/Tetstr1/438266/TSEL_026835.t1